jgi:hypothetical protein
MRIQDQQVLKETKDLRVQRVQKDQQRQKVLKESRVIQHLRVLQGTKVRKVTKVSKEILVTKVLVDRLVSKDHKETRHKDLRVRKETHLRVLRVTLDHPHKDLKDPKVTRDLEDHKDLLETTIPVLKDR